MMGSGNLVNNNNYFGSRGVVSLSDLYGGGSDADSVDGDADAAPGIRLLIISNDFLVADDASLIIAPYHTPRLKLK